MRNISLLVVVLLTASASAAVIEDFQGYNLGDSYGGGTIVVDPEKPNNYVLSLDGGQTAVFPTPAGAGIMTVEVYDMGVTTHDAGEPNLENSGYGPRWGVAGGGKSVAASITNRTFISATNGYGWSNMTTRTGSWFTVYFFGAPRLVDSLQVIGEGTWDDPDVPGEGAWTTWTFFIDASGLVTMTNDVNTVQVANEIPAGGLEEIWLSGGRAGFPLSGTALFNNVTFVVPEPATLGLLAVGALAMLRRRRA